MVRFKRRLAASNLVSPAEGPEARVGQLKGSVEFANEVANSKKVSPDSTNGLEGKRFKNERCQQDTWLRRSNRRPAPGSGSAWSISPTAEDESRRGIPKDLTPKAPDEKKHRSMGITNLIERNKTRMLARARNMLHRGGPAAR